nr:hypothetical protein [Tanacetum cinerariifolium]
MSTPTFAETYNLIAFLEKPTESDGFEKIIDFLNANLIKYALTVSPTIYTSCIKQFWTSAKVKTVNDDVQIQALVDRKKIVINVASIKRDLILDDVEGTACLPNVAIFEELARMWYKKPSQKLTFYKAFFSPQWKFLIHTILQCHSAKTSAWNEFSSTMASAVICLANQKFNFSKYILENMVKNLEAGVKFFMFPRFIQVFVNHQIGDMSHHKGIFVNPSLTKKTNQAAEIKKLKKREEKVEGKKKKRTHRLKRLYKVGLSAKIVSSDEQDQGRINDQDLFGVHDLDNDEVFVDVIIGKNVKQDAKVAEKTLMEIKEAKPKAKGVTIQEPSEFRKRSLSQPSQAKDKEAEMKAEMDEEERIAKEKNEVDIAMIKEWDDESLKKTQAKVTKGSSKRAGEKLKQESAKKHKLDEEVQAKVADDDTTELKRCLEIVSEDDDDVTIEATPLSSKSPTINFNREDLEVLRSIVKERFKKTKPVDDMENLLFQTLKTMFEHHVEDII